MSWTYESPTAMAPEPPATTRVRALDVRALRHPSEPSRFALALVSTAVGSSLVVFALLVVLTTTEMVMPVLYVVGLIVVLWVVLQLWRIRLLADAVKVDAATLPRLDAIVQDVRERLDYRGRADVFVVDRLNRVLTGETRTATVTSFFGVRVILLEGGLVGDLAQEEDRRKCTFVLATLVGALKARHAQWGTVLVLLSTLKLTVIVAPLVTPWLRATVYTGDRLAYACCEDLEVSLRGAYRSLVGSEVAGQLRPGGLAHQALVVRRSLVLRLSQLLRATPHVPNRYLELLGFAGALQPESYRLIRDDLQDATARVDALVARHRTARTHPGVVPMAVTASAGVLAAAVVAGSIGTGPAEDWLRAQLVGAGLGQPSPEPTTSPTSKLLALVPASVRGTCSALPATELAHGAAAAVRCRPGGDVATVEYLAFSDRADMRSTFDAYTESVPDGGDCKAGTPAVIVWYQESAPAGRMACGFTSGQQPVVVWTEKDPAVLGTATGAGSDLAVLYEWWNTQPSLAGDR